MADTIKMTSELDRSRMAQLIGAFENKRILVLGDLMLDEFIWGRVRRISPEAPVPVVEVERQTLSLGGAGNVASNLVTLGARPIPLGVVGIDAEADRMRSVFSSMGVSTEAVLDDRSRHTTLKTRIIAHNQQVVRADRESRASISNEIEKKAFGTFTDELDSADAVVISDYGKGFLTEWLVARSLKQAHKSDHVVCVDPKSRTFGHYQPVTVITPNNQEAAIAAGISADDDERAVLEAGRRLVSSLDCRAALITRGEEGMTLFQKSGEITNIPTVAREVYDVTGAGDTVIATLTLALTCGASAVEAAVLANYAAGVVVGKLGTATVTRTELIAAVGAAD